MLIGVVGTTSFGGVARSQELAAPAKTQEPAPAAALQQVPLAPQVKGPRPRVNPALVTPAATTLQPAVRDLAAPASLALPVRPDQVRIQQLRPIGLPEALNLAEVNNPNLKAVASQVEQAQSALRAQIALWYPSINLNLREFPSYTGGQQFSLAGFAGGGTQLTDGLTATSIRRMTADLEASWALINPTRTPQIAAARDTFEKAKYQYIIGLRELRLQVAQAYFDLQQTDDGVRIGQESVRASLVSLRDAKARYQAGVDTKLAVLQAETQLARDQQVLSDFLASQEVARRALAALLDLPQTVTPTAKDPSGVAGTWQASLQDSIVAAYAFREELDQALLDISIANSNANEQLGRIQPFLNIVNTLRSDRSTGTASEDVVGTVSGQTPPNSTSWGVDNSIGLSISWNLFDGGAARARYRQGKQQAQQNTYRFAQRRDEIRQEVETSFYELEKNNRNITTTAREVISARESLRLARLRFQAGVTTQREVVDTQRDLTQAEVRHSNAISDYNKRLVELQRRTGLDQIAVCARPALPADKPVGTSSVPVEPSPLIPGCQAAL
ncbi:MAG: TolC family protein [Cyanobacteriota bacterium]